MKRRSAAALKPGSAAALKPGSAGAGAVKQERNSTLLVFLAYATVVAAGVLSYWPSLRYEILNWDDPVYITNNPWIQGLTWDHVRQMFTKPYFANYLPLHLFSYALDYQFWGMKTLGFHFGSILLNALNGALALLVVRRLTKSLAMGFIAALLFAVHPSHVEAVAWISSRKELLSSTFAFLSFYAYLRARSARSLRVAPYVLSVVFFTLGLLSKVSVVVLPVFLVLVDLVPPAYSPRQKRPSLWQIVWTKLPYAAVGAVLLFVNSRVQVQAKAAYAHEALRYAMVKGHAVWNYLGLLVGFRTGSPDYDLPKLATDPARVLLELSGLAVLPVLAWVAYRRRRPLEFLGLGWIFVTLLPAIAFPLVTYMADRYLYAPSLGFCWLLAVAIVAGGRYASSAAIRPWMVAALTAVPLVGFTIRAQQYLPVWRNAESLWTYAATKSEDYRVFNNLGEVRSRQKRYEEAERLFRRGARVPNVTSYRNLAILYYKAGQFDRALGASDSATTILRDRGWDPIVGSEIQFERGAIYYGRGDLARAAEAWAAALQDNPNNANARLWLARVRPQRGGG